MWYRAKISLNSITSKIDAPVAENQNAELEIEIPGSSKVENQEVKFVKAVQKAAAVSRKRPKNHDMSDEVKQQLVKNDAMLKDDTINLAQSILYKQFEIRGLEHTGLNPDVFSVHSSEAFIQILHSPPLHWITVSSSGDNATVEIYDSLTTHDGKLPERVIHTIAHMIKVPSPSLRLKWMPVQQQRNHYDCGLFAIAFAVDIAFGDSPCSSSYDASELRKHLLKCLQNKSMLQFPKITRRVVKSKPCYYDINIYCICRDVFFQSDIERHSKNHMARCSSCNDWFHKKCVNIPNKVFTSEEEHKKWKCPSCVSC